MIHVWSYCEPAASRSSIGDLPAHLLEQGGEEGPQTLRIVAGGQLGRADKVGEEDCDGLALPEGRT